MTGPVTLYFSYRVKDFSAATWAMSGNGFFLGVGENFTLISPATSTFQDTGWREASAEIPAGEHAVRWQLTAFRGDTDQVRAYVDQVWTSDDARPRITQVSASGSFATPFSWTVPVASTTPVTLAVTGLPPGLEVEPGTLTIAGTPTAAGEFEATLTASNANGAHVAKVTFAIEPGSATIGETVDAPHLVFTQPGDTTVWAGVTGLGHDGVDTARASLDSATSNPDGGSFLETTLNGPGTLSFWYRCEGADAFDRTLINLYVGKPTSSPPPTQQLQQTDWTQVTVPIPAGQQMVSWGAVRAIVFEPQEPALYCYLDQVEFTPATVPPQSTFAAWREAWSVTGQPLATDADGDGLTLLMEYATGGSPVVANPELAPAVSLVDGHFTITLPKAGSPTDLLYLAEGSRTLSANSWTTSLVEVVDEDSTHLVMRSKKPASEEPFLYLRARVVLLAETVLPATPAVPHTSD